MKVCSVCKTEKSDKNFGKNIRLKSKLDSANFVLMNYRELTLALKK